MFMDNIKIFKRFGLPRAHLHFAKKHLDVNLV